MLRSGCASWTASRGAGRRAVDRPDHRWVRLPPGADRPHRPPVMMSSGSTPRSSSGHSSTSPRDAQAVGLAAGLDDVGAEGGPVDDGGGEPGAAKVWPYSEKGALKATATEARDALCRHALEVGAVCLSGHVRSCAGGVPVLLSSRVGSSFAGW